jgi:hypothetical protein
VHMSGASLHKTRAVMSVNCITVGFLYRRPLRASVRCPTISVVLRSTDGGKFTAYWDSN